MDDANYQQITKSETPFITLDDNKSIISIVAGKVFDKKGPVTPYSDVLILRMVLKAGVKKEIPIPDNFNALVYQLEGITKINDVSEISGKKMVHFNNDGTSIVLECKED